MVCIICSYVVFSHKMFTVRSDGRNLNLCNLNRVKGTSQLKMSTVPIGQKEIKRNFFAHDYS